MKEVSMRPKNKLESNSWFLRFYGRDEDDICQCLEEIQKLVPEFDYVIKPSTVSANIVIPDTDRPVTDAVLYFDNVDALERVKSDAVSVIYHKWATNHPEDCELVIRKPQESAWRV